MPKVSVIIPVYEVEPYLRRCLDSVINQTLSDIEIICINDGSPDNSLSILKEYVADDSRVKIIDFPENKGVSCARNAGIDAACGEYIGFVDPDDYIDLDFYEKLYQKAKETDADVVKSNLKFIGWHKSTGESYYNLAQVEKNKVNFNHVPTAIFRKEFLEKDHIRFPEDLKCAEDSVFEVLASIACNKIEIVENVAYYYVFRDESLNHTEFVTLDKLKEVEKSVKRAFEIFANTNIDKETYFEIMDLRYKYISFFCKNRKLSDEAKKYLPIAERNVLFSIKNKDEFLKRKFEQRVTNAWKAKAKQLQSKSDYQINKSEIDIKIKEFDDFGLTSIKRSPKFIVSLTSFPERMYDIHYCLYSLLNQSLKPDEVVLWLGEDQFPNGENDIPKEVLKFKEFGLKIEFTKDIKSYKKLIPALKKYPNDVIVTADDDIFYPSGWFEKLYKTYLEDDKNILCHRVHRIKFNANDEIDLYKNWEKVIKDETSSFLNFATGAGGILYPPNSLHKDVLNEKLFMKLAPKADDIWFWAMALLNNRKIRVVENHESKLRYINYEREHGLNGEVTLYSTNIIENDIQLKNVLKQYPQVFEIIKKEALINA